MTLKNQKPILINCFLFLLSTIVFTMVHHFHSEKNPQKEVAQIQEYVLEQERILKSTLLELSHNKEISTFQDLEKFKESKTLVYVYQHDSLVCWNSNTQKISLILDKYIDGISIQKFQNGWYLTGTVNKDRTTYRVAHKIYDDYPIQNAYLKNGFSDKKLNHLNYSLSFDDETGYQINNSKNSYLFSLQSLGPNKIDPSQEFLITGLLFICISSFLRVVFLITQRLKPMYQIALWSVVIIIRWISLTNNWMVSFKNYTIFQANLFGVDFFAPNLFEFLISLIVFIGTTSLLLKMSIRKFTPSPILFFIYRVYSLVIWSIFSYYISAFVFHSTIPLATADLFQLNAYSILAILIIGGVCLYFYQVTEYIQVQKNKNYLAQGILFALWFLIAILFLNIHWSLALYPIILILLLYIFQLNTKFHSAISYLIFAFASSTIIALAVQYLYTQKELENRYIFASQLFNERDYNTELSIKDIDSLLLNDRTLQFYLKNQSLFSGTQLDNYLDKKYFNTLSSNYDFSFFLFDSLNINLSNQQEPSTQLYSDFNTIIEQHGDKSEINPDMYFIHDYIAQFSYVVKTSVELNGQKIGTLIFGLKSKKNPETIGFPKLLIPNSSDNQALLDHYSFAKYHQNIIVYQYGEFEYPFISSEVDKWNIKDLQSFDHRGFNHSIYKYSDDNIIVVSVKLNTFFELTTSISFFFCCFLFLMVLSNIPLIWVSLKHTNWNRLATKIQVIIICLTILILVITTWGTGSFFREQFNILTQEQIQDKTNAVEQDLRNTVGRMENLPSMKDYSSLNAQLRRLCRIHKTDINLYNNSGHLIATSRLQLYNIGLLSEQMNPDAYQVMNQNSLNHFLHEEHIGNLNYSSSYMPINNITGLKIGFVNLQFFGQQENVVTRMNELFATLINIFLIVFVLSTILTVIVGSWITSPLRQLHTSLNSLKFGRNMSRLKYDKKDEIGDLVEDYNTKLQELETAAVQLAKSERESAWRDMAKQVAHEIKNPLTPMKLSVQHLKRSFDPNDPDLEQKINRVSNSLIEQIDALTRIANEFSNFAKMPIPQIEKFDLVELIKGVLSIFENESSTVISYDGLENVTINGDKNQLLRVINNLLKNALQAISHTDGKILISTKIEGEDIIIRIKDNGSGIPEEQIEKMFVPYFTTKNTGTGLGLSMVKQIIENHGGTIAFETEKGKGTCFTIKLPNKKSL